MENKFKNEMEIELAGEKILLRPNFENLAMMETKMGGVAYLAYKYGGGYDVETGKIDPAKAAKALPPLTDAAQIIYFNQAEKKYTLEEIHSMLLQTGIKACFSVVMFLARCTAGNKLAKEPSTKQKKS